MKMYGLRRIGFAFACYAYYEKHNRYPQNPTELLEVTNSKMSAKRFDGYLKWFKFIELTGGDI